MTRNEKNYILLRESHYYRIMRQTAHTFGRQSEEFQVARATWYGVYSICCELNLFEGNEDNED